MNNYLKDLRVRILQDFLSRFGFLPKAYPEEYAEIWDKIAAIKVLWTKEKYNYVGKINGHLCFLRINKEREEPRYTLLFNQKAILSFNNLPVIMAVRKLIISFIFEVIFCFVFG